MTAVRIRRQQGRKFTTKKYALDHPRVKARRGVELLCMMEDNDLEWYDFADVDLDVNLNDVPLQSKRHGTPIMPVEERNPIWEDNEE